MPPSTVPPARRFLNILGTSPVAILYHKTGELRHFSKMGTCPSKFARAHEWNTSLGDMLVSAKPTTQRRVFIRAIMRLFGADMAAYIQSVGNWWPVGVYVYMRDKIMIPSCSCNEHWNNVDVDAAVRISLLFVYGCYNRVGCTDNSPPGRLSPPG